MDKEALFYETLDNQQVRCTLCPHRCKLQDGQSGICRVRYNKDGTLYTGVYGRFSALNTDPVEKKPLYHFYPGRPVLSVGGLGCNLSCSFCQNWQIAHCSPGDMRRMRQAPPKKLVGGAEAIPGNMGIAFTYNEPIVWYEFMLDIASEAQVRGLKTLMVSNGYIEQAPLKKLLPHIDAFNIDLKAYSDAFYKKYTKSRFAPVWEAIRTIARSGKHLELTYLLIPGANDSIEAFKAMLGRLADEAGPDVPLHISRYHPAHKLRLPPTPPALLKTFYQVAKEYLHYVFLGNIHIPGTANTYCKSCGHLLIERDGFSARITGLEAGGRCEQCHTVNVVDN